MISVGHSAGGGAILLVRVGSPKLVAAYRLFDGTDAAVADPQQIEIELGPVEYRRDGAERTLLAPSAVLNYGFAPDWETTVEGRAAYAIAGGGTGLTDAAAPLKGIVREGALQDKPGPSVAAEFGVLLPGAGDNRGAGVSDHSAGEIRLGVAFAFATPQ